MPRWDLERLAGAKNSPRAGVGFDLYFAFEDNALVMVLAAGRPGHWFHVLGPAPPRLVDEAGDVRLAEKHDLNGYERKRDELIRLVESPRLEPRPAGLLAGTFAAKGSTVRDTEAHQYWARIGHGCLINFTRARFAALKSCLTRHFGTSCSDDHETGIDEPCKSCHLDMFE